MKKNQVARFLEGGDKVKVSIMLRGREQSRPVGGIELMQRLAGEVEDSGTVESAPRRDGRNIIMVLAPKGKKVHKQSEQRRRGAGLREERQARQQARLTAKKEAQKAAAEEAHKTLESLGIEPVQVHASSSGRAASGGSKPHGTGRASREGRSTAGSLKTARENASRKAASKSSATAKASAKKTSSRTAVKAAKKASPKEGNNAKDEK